MLQHRGGHQRVEGQEGDRRPLERYCGERQKQGREKGLIGSHGGGAEQRVLVWKRDGVRLLLA